MRDILELKGNLKINFKNNIDFLKCIEDLIENEAVCSMKKYMQHGSVSCLEHCLNVSYRSYQIAKFIGANYRETARGALLHDFFLYDWHDETSIEGLHGFSHARTALKNAELNFVLTKIEKDIILKHMWPLNLKPPVYIESVIVLAVDKACALIETILTPRIKMKEMKRA